MRISCQTNRIDRRMGKMAAIKMIREAGFDAYDLSLYAMTGDDPELAADTFHQTAQALRVYADKLGIVCNQAHAPFPSSTGDPQKDEWIFSKLVDAMEAASVVGAKCIVIHPVQHLCYAEYAAELFEMNVAFYQKLIPYAVKFGIKIAVENMWQNNNGTKTPTDSVCSRSWEFNKLIDAVDSPWLVGCFDVGHASLVRADIPDFIHCVGNQRLQALHLHDTDFARDLHTLPFTQKIDYEAVAKALGEIDYLGDVTFEANGFLQNFPDELLLSALRLMADVGKYLTQRITAARNAAFFDQ